MNVYNTFWLVVYSLQYEFSTSQSQADTLYGNPPEALKPIYTEGEVVKKDQIILWTSCMEGPRAFLHSVSTLLPVVGRTFQKKCMRAFLSRYNSLDLKKVRRLSVKPSLK